MPYRYKKLATQHAAPVALAGQTGGAIRVVLDFLFLLHQGKRKENDFSFKRKSDKQHNQ
jgi:hypothetical protein